MTTAIARRSWLKTAALAALCVYWPLIFIGTHLSKNSHLIRPFEHSDKVMHFSAYTGLAFLVALNWWLRRPFGWRQRLMVVGLGAFYGMVDELTQIPAGRDCEFLDWVADVCGSTTGVTILVAIATFWFGAQLRSGEVSPEEA